MNAVRPRPRFRPGLVCLLILGLAVGTVFFVRLQPTDRALEDEVQRMAYRFPNADTDVQEQLVTQFRALRPSACVALGKMLETSEGPVSNFYRTSVYPRFSESWIIGLRISSPSDPVLARRAALTFVLALGPENVPQLASAIERAARTAPPDERAEFAQIQRRIGTR